jgi:hypothetical protein
MTAGKTNLAIIAVIAAIGIIGVLVVESFVVPLQQQAGAAKSTTGQCASTVKNASAFACHTF